MPDPAAIGVDVGGTKILGALVDADGAIITHDVVPTPSDPGAVLAAVERVVEAVGHGTDGLPLGVGFPALITGQGRVVYGPNIAVRDHPLRERLAADLGVPVVVDNDATCATWAEFVVGAGRAAVGHMLMYTLGTGVGGGIVVDGRIVRGAHGFAGELGHVVVQADGDRGTSLLPGELEAYSSGRALGTMARHAHLQGRFAGTPLDGHAPPTAAQVAEAGADGVDVAVEILARAGRYLGIAAAGLVNALDPELIVVGGGAAAAGELILQPARQAMAAHVLGGIRRPEVPMVSAALGPDAGVIGAALLAVDAAG